MQSIRVVTVHDEEGKSWRISLPEAAKVEGTTVRMPVGEEYQADFGDEQGYIVMSPRALVSFATQGIDGFALVGQDVQPLPGQEVPRHEGRLRAL